MLDEWVFQSEPSHLIAPYRPGAQQPDQRVPGHIVGGQKCQDLGHIGRQAQSGALQGHEDGEWDLLLGWDTWVTWLPQIDPATENEN